MQNRIANRPKKISILGSGLTISSLSEYSKTLQACNMGPEVAKAVFNAVDKNNDRKIDPKELVAMGEKFWFSLEPVVEGMIN